jgi:hypothetical protein
MDEILIVCKQLQVLNKLVPLSGVQLQSNTFCSQKSCKIVHQGFTLYNIHRFKFKVDFGSDHQTINVSLILENGVGVLINWLQRDVNLFFPALSVYKIKQLFCQSNQVVCIVLSQFKFQSPDLLEQGKEPRKKIFQVRFRFVIIYVKH